MVLFLPATTCNLKTLDNDLQLPEPSNQWWHKTWSLFIPEGLMSHFSESESHLIVSDSLWPRQLYSPRNSPGQNTGVGSLSLLQGLFLTQELNQGLLHCRQILYQLSYQGSLIFLSYFKNTWPFCNMHYSFSYWFDHTCFFSSQFSPKLPPASLESQSQLILPPGISSA